MPKRTTPANRITRANHPQAVVKDKRESWRASQTKARQRQRRYTGLLMRQLLKQGRAGEEE